MSSTPQPGNQDKRSSTVRHRRESFWQITLPILVIVLVLVAALVAIILAGTSSISTAADASLVLVSLPLLLFGLVFVALFFGLVFGLGWIVRTLPSITEPAQDASHRISEIVQDVAKRVTDVIIPAITGFSMVQRFFGQDGTTSDEVEGHEET